VSQLERNKKLVLAQHREVWSRSDREAVERYYASEVVLHFAGLEVIGRLNCCSKNSVAPECICVSSKLGSEATPDSMQSLTPDNPQNDTHRCHFGN
jgi:hypothetical protein